MHPSGLERIKHVEPLTINEFISDYCQCQVGNFSAISWREQITFNEMMSALKETLDGMYLLLMFYMFIL
jgi:hypothetical protein